MIANLPPIVNEILKRLLVDEYRLYSYAPWLVLFVAVCAIVWLRFKRRYRTLRKLLINWELLVALLVSGPIIFLYYTRWGIPERFKQGELGFLICPLPGDVSQIEQNTYAQAIISAASQDPQLASVVKVRLLGRPLPNDSEQQHALAMHLGRRL